MLESIGHYLRGGPRADSTPDGEMITSQSHDEIIKTEMIPLVQALSGAYGVNAHDSQWTGDKFPGGFGDTKIVNLDYWVLRQRSNQLFTTNMYARGLIERLVTNEINTGLWPEAQPNDEILKKGLDFLDEWSDGVETRVNLWAKNPRVCHHEQKHTWYRLQEIAKREAYIKGDILVVLRQSRVTQLPTVQLVDADRVTNPYDMTIRQGHKIKQGVEIDANGRQVAYWVKQEDGKHKRLPAFGEKSGRRIAFLVYGSHRRVDGVRGEPLLSIILQSLREMDRYRDATLRKAVINSMLAMFIKKGEDKAGTNPMGGAAVTKREVSNNYYNKDDDVADNKVERRDYNIMGQVPGVVIEELQTGEEPVGYKFDGDINYGAFEQAIIQAVAWVNQVPPEILKLSFSSNYAASQAAMNEFKIYLNKVRAVFGDEFCQPIYNEVVINLALLGKIDAPGFLQSWRDPRQHDIFGAWLDVEWSGAIKPSNDIVKSAKGYRMMVEDGVITRTRATREQTGTKYGRNIKILERENKQYVKAMQPIVELREKLGMPLDKVAEAMDDLTDKLQALSDDAEVS